MRDLFGREKPGQLPGALASGALPQSTYQVGDLAYWSPSRDVATFYHHDGQSPNPGMDGTNSAGSFAGKVAFVTGAATGIGRAAAMAFARQGASVVVTDVSEQDNQETARMIEELGGRALAVRCDVSRAEDVRRALDAAIEAFGHLDLAFNNASVEHSPTAVADLAEERSERGSPRRLPRPSSGCAPTRPPSSLDTPWSSTGAKRWGDGPALVAAISPSE